MGIKIIAAACMLLGVTSGVQAAPFTIEIGSATSADGGIGFTLTGDTRSGTASLNYDEHEQSDDFLSFLSTSFGDPNAMVARSKVSSAVDSFGFAVNSAEFTVTNLSLPFVVTSDSGLPESRTGYGFSFTLFQDVAPDGMIFQYEAASGNTVLGSAFLVMDASVTVTGNPLSPVPLPASAPLFGTALLVMAGLCYAKRRRRDASAAA